jgi:hypothetical protein
MGADHRSMVIEDRIDFSAPLVIPDIKKAFVELPVA